MPLLLDEPLEASFTFSMNNIAREMKAKFIKPARKGNAEVCEP